MKIGIIADIHEDVASLTKVLKRLDAEKCDLKVCLGDILGYNQTFYTFRNPPDANECIRLVKENFNITVAGNHDLFAMRKIPQFTAGFIYNDDWYLRPRIERLKMTRGRLWAYSEWEEQIKLSDDSIEFLYQLPEYNLIHVERLSILFSHFLYPDLSGSTTRFPEWIPGIWPHLSWMKKMGCNLGFSGHTHTKKTLIGTRFSLHSSDRIIHQIDHSPTWITCLPIVSGNVPNGFMTFLTESSILKIHILNQS